MLSQCACLQQVLHLYCVCACCLVYCYRYLKGQDLLALSAELDFPPCMLLRRLLEHLVPGSKQVWDSS
jgi:hypothetical protein